AGFHSTADAIALLTKAYGGQAQAYADTFAGKLSVLKAKAEDLGKDLGLKLIPAVEGVTSGLLSGVQGLESANAATGGYLGKVALVAAGVPLAATAIDKLSTAYEAGKAKVLAFAGVQDAATV